MATPSGGECQEKGKLGRVGHYSHTGPARPCTTGTVPSWSKHLAAGIGESFTPLTIVQDSIVCQKTHQSHTQAWWGPGEKTRWCRAAAKQASSGVKCRNDIAVVGWRAYLAETVFVILRIVW